MKKQKDHVNKNKIVLTFLENNQKQKDHANKNKIIVTFLEKQLKTEGPCKLEQDCLTFLENKQSLQNELRPVSKHSTFKSIFLVQKILLKC